MVAEMTPSAPVFEALIAACDRAFDHYYWLGEHELREPLDGVRDTAEQVLDEYETVQRAHRRRPPRSWTRRPSGSPR